MPAIMAIECVAETAGDVPVVRGVLSCSVARARPRRRGCGGR